MHQPEGPSSHYPSSNGSFVAPTSFPSAEQIFIFSLQEALTQPKSTFASMNLSENVFKILKGCSELSLVVLTVF